MPGARCTPPRKLLCDRWWAGMTFVEREGDHEEDDLALATTVDFGTRGPGGDRVHREWADQLAQRRQNSGEDRRLAQGWRSGDSSGNSAAIAGARGQRGGIHSPRARESQRAPERDWQ